MDGINSRALLGTNKSGQHAVSVVDVLLLSCLTSYKTWHGTTPGIYCALSFSILYYCNIIAQARMAFAHFLPILKCNWVRIRNVLKSGFVCFYSPLHTDISYHYIFKKKVKTSIENAFFVSKLGIYACFL